MATQTELNNKYFVDVVMIKVERKIIKNIVYKYPLPECTGQNNKINKQRNIRYLSSQWMRHIVSINNCICAWARHFLLFVINNIA